MKVGDSILGEDIKIQSASLAYGKNHGLKFVSKKQSDGSGYRVWRIA